MSIIPVEKINGDGSQSPSFTRKLEKIGDRVRQRAHEIFQHRGSDPESESSAAADWFQAEREMILHPDSELIEKDGRYEITVAAPGFKPTELEISALPDALVISGESTHKHERNDENVHFCEFGRKSLFRRFLLPAKINADKVSANLNNGILRITAQKTASTDKTLKARA